MRAKARFHLSWVLVSLVAVFLIIGAASQPAGAADFVWRMAMPWPVPAQDKIHSEFIQNVKEFTGGKVEITYYLTDS